jgi:hypothetical protein
VRIITLTLCMAATLFAAGLAIAADAKALKLPWFDLRPGIVRPHEVVLITAWVENTSTAAIPGVTVRLVLPNGVKPVGDEPLSRSIDLKAREPKRITWRVEPQSAGTFAFAVETALGPAAGPKREQTLSVVERRDEKREFEDLNAAWRPFPARPTLQDENHEPVTDFQSLPSGKLKHNLFGITAHLARDTDDESPFIAANAIDGDPATCWGSQWWRTDVTFEPEWIELDLGQSQSLAEVRFLPGWQNTGVPTCFTIQSSIDGKAWDTVVEQTDYHLQQAPPGDKLRYGNLSWQCFPCGQRPARYVRLQATRLGQGPTSFFCCPGDPYQLRIAELVLLDKDKKPLTSPQTKVSVSTTHRAWFNSPETIKKTWPLIFRSGVKLNRVGQWGDKLDWATVEQTKGKYVVAPDVDRAVTESVNNGVDIVLTLDYGNNLYQRLKDPQDFGKSTWFRSHPFLQCAPTTPEAVEGFANYCRFMAKHFRGRVKYFEIWNEENGWFFDAWSTNNSVNMVKAYGRALTAAAKAVKEANPDAVVVFGGVAGCSLDFPRIAMEQGAGPYIDVFAFHPYGSPTPETVTDAFVTQVGDTMQNQPRPGHIKNYEDTIRACKDVFRPYKPNMPIWADEMNWFAPGYPPSGEFMFADHSELTQAKYLARFFTLNAALDSAAIWWSLYNANHVQEWALVRSADFSPRPAFYSAGYVATALDDCRGAGDVKAEPVGPAPSDLVIKGFRNGKGQRFIGVWRASAAADNNKPTPVTLRLPKTGSAEIIDTLYGVRQKAVVRLVGESTQAPGLLVGDWPLILRLED